jgi:hypothetical protein
MPFDERGHNRLQRHAVQGISGVGSRHEGKSYTMEREGRATGPLAGAKRHEGTMG